MVVVGVVRVLGVAKAGERTIEWSSVWAVACDVVRSVWVAADQGSGMWSGLLFLMETQSLNGGVGLGGLVVGVSGEWSELKCVVGRGQQAKCRRCPMLCRVIGGKLTVRPGRSLSAVGNRTSEAESSSRVDSSSWR